MKAILMIILLAGSALAQDQAAAARAAAGCGSNDVYYDVKTDKHQHPIPQPEPGKALVYVIQDFHLGICIGGCDIFRVGVDGGWVGANQGASYLYFPVDPGDHRLCMNWQSKIGKRTRVGGAAVFNAEPGKAYYFRLKQLESHDEELRVKLELIDSAEAQLLIAATPFSTSHPKK